MTRAQKRTIELIKNEAINQLFHDKENYEFKRFETIECETFVDVRLETGLKGDEGTYAAIFARDFVQLFIGKRGGISYINKRGTRKHLKYINLYQVIFDCRH